MHKITLGRIVHYVLSEQEATEINRRRTDGPSIAARIKESKWPLGGQAHIGNQVEAGQVYPAISVRIWSDVMANFQVLLDGNDCYWATSRSLDASKAPGTWHWPARE